MHPKAIIDVKGLPGLTDLLIVRNGRKSVRIGAAVTMNAIVKHPDVQRHYPLLAEACNSVASYQLRNRATIGGNICNASPAADSAPALICYGAEALIYGPEGRRRVLGEDFFQGPGRSAFQAGELLGGRELPVPARGAAR